LLSERQGNRLLPPPWSKTVNRKDTNDKHQHRSKKSAFEHAKQEPKKQAGFQASLQRVNEKTVGRMRIGNAELQRCAQPGCAVATDIRGCLSRRLGALRTAQHASLIMMWRALFAM
jgi:hypothetical protein